MGPGERRFVVEIASPDHYRLLRGKTNITKEHLAQAIKRMGVSEGDAIQIMNLGLHETSRIYKPDSSGGLLPSSLDEGMNSVLHRRCEMQASAAQAAIASPATTRPELANLG